MTSADPLHGNADPPVRFSEPGGRIRVYQWLRQPEAGDGAVDYGVLWQPEERDGAVTYGSRQNGIELLLPVGCSVWPFWS